SAVDTIGPFGMALDASIKAGRLGGNALINIFSLFLYQVIGLPKLAFKTASVSFFAVAVFKSKIHNSFPLSVVFVKAILFSSGDQESLLIFAFAGRPFTSLYTLSATFFSFIIFMKVVLLEISVMGGIRKPANRISS